MITYIRSDFQNIRKRIMNRIAYYNRVKQRTAVFRNSRGLFNNIRQIYRPEWTDADYWTRLNHAIGMGYQINQVT
jgi:hypothetical protein